MARGVGAAIALAAAFMTLPAAAAVPLASTPVRVRYRAPDDCPSADAFLEAVKRIAPDVRGADEDEPARVIDVTIEPSADATRALGRLTIVGGGARTIDAASCVEATGLLAFAAALAIEGGEDAKPRPSEPPVGPSEARRDRTATRSTAAAGAARQNISLHAGLFAATNPDGAGVAIGAGALYRRRSFVVGAVAGLGTMPSSWLWTGSVAAGLATNPLPWLRVDALGTLGIDAYTGASPPDESGDSHARAVLPVVGTRVRASVDVANVLIGLEACAETDLWSVTRSYTPYPYVVGSPTNRRGTFSVGGPRAALGIVLGTSFDL